MQKLAITFILLMIILVTGVAQAEMRIVSLKPAITDVFVAMEISDMLVGVTKHCDTPNELPIVGDYTKPYIEKIIALRPDIVLNSKENSSRKSIERLESTGIKVELLSFNTTDDMTKSIKRIGILTNETEKANQLALSMQNKLTSTEQKWKDSKKPRVLIVWGRNPMIVAGASSYMSEHMDTIGATNALMNSKLPYPKIGLEELIAMDPDVIVDLSMGSEKDGSDGKIWSGQRALKAVRENRVYTMDTSTVRRGPKLPDGLEKLAELIHSN